jgi:hypothetical protein
MPLNQQSHGTSSTTIRSTTLITNEAAGIQHDTQALTSTDDITRM